MPRKGAPNRRRHKRSCRCAQCGCHLARHIRVLVPGVSGNAYFLLEKNRPLASMASALSIEISSLELRPRERVCMDNVALTSTSRIAQFSLLRSARASGPAPPVNLHLSAPGYADYVSLPEGSNGGREALRLTFDVTPPRRSEIGTACLSNVGRTPLLLEATTAPRTTSRSVLTRDGKPVPATWCSDSSRSTGCRD